MPPFKIEKALLTRNSSLPILALALSCAPIVDPQVGSPGEPIARFSYECYGLRCSMDGSESEGFGGTAASFVWDLGDGSVDSTAVVDHQYQGRGSYEVRLTITNDSGQSHSVTDIIRPTGDAPLTWLFPGEDLQAAIDSHEPGTEFTLKSGVHYLGGIRPKDGSSFSGEPGTVLSGALVLSNFVFENPYWTVSDLYYRGPSQGVCDPLLTNADGSVYTGCRLPEDIFFDDVVQFRVEQLSEMAPGRWFYDYEAGKIYVADDPLGVRVELSVRREAFLNVADNVTIRDLIIEKYANEAQHGAIHAGGHAAETLTSGWTVDDVELRWNHGSGIRLGHGMHVRNSFIHHNGQMGITGQGNGILIEGSDISYNNTRGFHPGWEAGGTKFVRTTDLIVRNNQVHNNKGPGLWTDIDNFNVLYDSNHVFENAKAGIFHEISYKAIIRGNRVERNGHDSPQWLYGAGILVAHSSDVEVYDNTVVDNANGIGGIQQARGEGSHGPHVLENLWVHNNHITMTVGRTGIAQDVRDPGVFTSRNNRFDENVYFLGPNATYFEYADAQRTEAQWIGYGMDSNGVMNRSSSKR